VTVEAATVRRRRIRADRPTVAVDVFLYAMKAFLVFFALWAVVGAVALQMAGESLTAAAWRDVIVGGLAQGSMYGLIALGYSMVYGILGFINFAHGEVFMSGAMSGFFVANALFEAGLWDSAFPIAFALVLLAAMLTSSIVAVTVERVAYRRLRGAPRLIPLITSIGVSFFIQYSVRGLFGAGFKRYPELPQGLRQPVSIFGLEIQASRLFVIGVAMVAMVGLWWFVTRSKTGRAIRAVAEDREIAGLMGIDVDKTIVKVFAVGGVMAGVAGIMWALLFRSVFFLTGFLPGIKAFTSAVLGGIGNLPGAMLGGLTLGMMEAAGPTLLGSLRWAIPTWLAYVVGVAAVAGVVRGVMVLRVGTIRQVSRAMALVVVGGLLAVFAFTIMPGFQVVIPGPAFLKDMIAFIVLIGVLMLRPVGLLGERLAVEERG
jgi:branched-chain amino acid transport system permease protein